MRKLINFQKKYWFLVLISSLAFIVRIFKLNDLFYFTYDEEVPALIGRRLILWHHMPLIGGATPFGFHLGPYFYWFYAFLLLVSKLNPVIWGVAGAGISIITIILIFLLTKKVGGKKLATTAAIFWAFSYLANIYDRHLWALYWGTLVSLITVYSLTKIIEGKYKYIYLLAITSALAIHADLSNLVFFGLTIIAWVAYKLPLNRNTILAAFFVPLLITPLVVFDLRHDFANTKPIGIFLENNRDKNKPSFSAYRFIENSILFPRTFSRIVYTFGDNEAAKQYSYCKEFINEKFDYIPNIIIFISSIALIAYLYWSLKMQKNPLWILISLTTLIYYFGIQLYGTILNGDVLEHYITGLLPFFLMIAALIVSKLPRKLWVLALIIFMYSNLAKLSLAKNSQGLSYKKQAIEFVNSQVGNQSFSLESLSTCWRYSGYRYLFAVFGKEPVKSFVDPNFGYLYGTTAIASNHPDTVVVFVAHNFIAETEDFYKRHAVFKSHETSSAIFGSIEVIIMDNSLKWFDKNN